jgi:hypothetical protein
LILSSGLSSVFVAPIVEQRSLPSLFDRSNASQWFASSARCAQFEP